VTGQFEWSKEKNHCFGCGDNEWGLRLDFRRENGWVVAETTLHDNYQGFKGKAHGGIIATILDEAASWAAILQEEVIAPSYEIDCRIKRPVPLGEPIQVRGRVREIRHGVIFSEAQVLSREGEVLAWGKIKSKRPG
jgi:acyl-coenzyme A thioesterase PaaI-like protein